MLGVSRCKMRHLQTILGGSTVCFGHNHRQPRTEIFNSRRRSNEGIKRGAIWDFMTGKSPWGNPQIPILLLNGQGEKTPFVESLPLCFSTEPDYPSRHRSACGYWWCDYPLGTRVLVVIFYHGLNGLDGFMSCLEARQKHQKPLGEDGGRCPCCYASALVL